MNLTHRKARIVDLPRLIELLLEDELGQTRESKSSELDENYIKAFHKIDRDPNQYLMVLEQGDEMIGTCHLTIMPSLTFIGSTLMQIEAVRVAGKYRGQKIGFCRKNYYGREPEEFWASLCRKSIKLFKNSLTGRLVMLSFSEHVV